MPAASTPVTIVGIKRLAKSLGRDRSIPHVSALNEAARAAGFQNYAHAQRALTSSDRPERSAPSVHELHVSVPWRDAGGASGMERVCVELVRPLDEAMTRAQLASGYLLSSFHRVAGDHIAQYRGESGAVRARRVACLAARSVQFTAATGLHMSSGHVKGLPKSRVDSDPPGRDHSFSAYLPERRAYVFVDEPYHMEEHLEDRREWAKQHGWAVAFPTWPGIHNPHGNCRMGLAADPEKVDLEKIVAALDALPPPVSEYEWTGVSTGLLDHFHSPMEAVESAERARRAEDRKAPKPVDPRMAVGARPDRMDVAQHAHVGALLKGAHQAHPGRRRYSSYLMRLRSRLDDWAAREHPSLPDDRFFDLYYGKSADIAQGDIPATLAALAEAASVLEASYRPLPAVRREMELIEKAQAALTKLMEPKGSGQAAA